MSNNVACWHRVCVSCLAAVVGALLAAPAAAQPREVRIAHLGQPDGDPAGLAALQADFVARNPGHDVSFHAGVRALAASAASRLAFVQSGEGKVGLGGPPALETSVADLIVLRPDTELRCSAALGLVVFTVPEPFPAGLPEIIRPDWDPKITDTPGGCATETGAYRRILLTWLKVNGAYTYRSLNAHRVRITDSFTHYHPLQGGFDEFYLVQGVLPGARLLTSTATERILAPDQVSSAEAKGLLERHELAVGDLVYLPRGVVHRGLGGVLAQVIAVPGFRPGTEIGVDDRLAAINQRLGLSLQLHRKARARDLAGVAVEYLDDRFRVTCDGKLFTEYRYRGHPKPILYPVLGPTGHSMTRHWPIASGPGEKKDHPHHRSLWFAHGAVNGHDFWAEGKRRGRIEQVDVIERGADRFSTRNRWIAADGSIVCTDTRTLSFHATPAARFIHWEVTLHASHGAVKLGDTKEGTMAIRMRPELRLAGAVAAGQALNSAGVRGKALWGKRAAWVSYFGPAGGAQLAITIVDDPRNHAHPTWWHARDYGLVAANPFGVHDFEKKPRGSGDVTIAAGGKLTFRYLFAFHEGPVDAGTVRSVEGLWAARPKPRGR